MIGMKISNVDRQAAFQAGKKGLDDALAKTRGRALSWWERLIWVVLSGVVAAASCLLAGCGHLDDWDELTPSQQQALQVADHAYHQWCGQPAGGSITMAEGGK